jgi:hypothetical protein
MKLGGIKISEYYSMYSCISNLEIKPKRELSVRETQAFYF